MARILPGVAQPIQPPVCAIVCLVVCTSAREKIESLHFDCTARKPSEHRSRSTTTSTRGCSCVLLTQKPCISHNKRATLCAGELPRSNQGLMFVRFGQRRRRVISVQFKRGSHSIVYCFLACGGAQSHPFVCSVVVVEYCKGNRHIFFFCVAGNTRYGSSKINARVRSDEIAHRGSCEQRA